MILLILLLLLLVLFVWESHWVVLNLLFTSVLRDPSWQCQDLFTVEEIKLGLAVCKASALIFKLFLSLLFVFFFHT